MVNAVKEFNKNKIEPEEENKNIRARNGEYKIQNSDINKRQNIIKESLYQKGLLQLLINNGFQFNSFNLKLTYIQLLL